MSFVHILAVILVLALLIAFHEFGHFICAKTLGVPVKIFSIGFPLGNMKPLLSYKWGETDCQLNALPLGGFCAFMDDENREIPDDEAEAVGVETEEFQPGDKRFLKNRKIWERSIIISGGVVANTIIAYLIFVGLNVAIGISVSDPNGGIFIGDVKPGNPAQVAGFLPGDKLLTINGQSIKTTEQMQQLVSQNKLKEISVVVERKTKQQTEQKVLKPVPSAEGTIGVSIGQAMTRRPVANPVEPFVRGGEDLQNSFKLLAGALIQLFTGQLGMKDVGGLVKVVQMGSDVSQRGLADLFFFAALISLELAILNVLPIPALDGGHLFLLIIEAVRGRPLTRKIEENLHYAGFMILIGLGIFLIFKDIWELTLGRG